VTLLGLACTIAYLLTGALWTITVLYWLVLVPWVLVVGGWQWLYPNKTANAEFHPPV
jgi:predicted Abi (CAAX) family protease